GFRADYSIFSTQTTSLLDYSFNVDDTLLSFSNVSIFSMNYKEHFNPFNVSDVWDSYLLQDKNATNYKLTDNISISSKPFTANRDLEESIFTYNINTTLYNRYFDSANHGFSDNYFYWNQDGITSHKASMELKYLTFDEYQILKLDTVLPPGNTELYPELILTTGPLISSVKTGSIFNKEDLSLPLNEWTFDPYEIYIMYNFFYDDYLKQTVSLDPEAPSNNFSRTELFLTALDSDITLKQNLEMKLNNWQMDKSSTDLKLWFTNFNFLAEDTYGYHLVSGWIEDSNSRFQPSKASAGLNYSYDPDPFWKNRIRLSANINSSWTMNLLKYTDTALNFSTKFTLDIAEFLELSFESTSVNRATYLYIPGLVS
ncbi:MAG: hypothetical protein KAR21_16225, partial [Spirochaetales bacterium]|nr:hypothetical protein [Spirochaetales bacterium]